MNRSWVIWSTLLLCAVVIFGSMAWMSRGVIRSEQDRIQAQAQAQVGERIGLALSRMDTIGAALLVVENQRPPLHYEAFFSPDDVFTAQASGLLKNEVQRASPLLIDEEEITKLHFEIRPDGTLSSPQVPSATQNRFVSQFEIDEDVLAKNRETFKELQALLGREAPEAIPSLCRSCHTVGTWNRPSEGALAIGNSWVESNWGTVAQNTIDQANYNNALQTMEQGKRSEVVSKEIQKASSRSLKGAVPQSKSNTVIGREELASLTPFQPTWVGEELFLVRQVTGSRSIKYQVVWLDHEKLTTELQSQIPEELTGARLLAVTEKGDDPLSLVTLPWRLETPALIIPALSLSSPVYQTLLMGWVAALISLGALVFLLRAVLRLSERRAAFVSSVTHELRTPLTTFRLYSEMLADGMVTDEVQKEEYLRTMLSESERLNHLVENVLSYARIERGNARSNVETLAVVDLMERIRPVLQRRVDQEDAALSVSLDDDLGELCSDVTAIEQILFNLIDNACKYGLSENGSKISLRASRSKNGLSFEVSDEGRGIAANERKRLFRAFHKSAQDAAYSQPGVGLGLALCRRLARALGGELQLAKGGEKGARFLLTLPAV